MLLINTKWFHNSKLLKYEEVSHGGRLFLYRGVSLPVCRHEKISRRRQEVLEQAVCDSPRQKILQAFLKRRPALGCHIIYINRRKKLGKVCEVVEDHHLKELRI